MNNQPRTPKRCSSAAQPFAVGATLLTRRRSPARVTELSAAHAEVRLQARALRCCERGLV